MVLKKLCPWPPHATEAMDSQFLERVVNTVFQEGEKARSLGSTGVADDWNLVLAVSEEQLAGANIKLRLPTKFLPTCGYG
jgi:hypothetical protein